MRKKLFFSVTLMIFLPLLGSCTGPDEPKGKSASEVAGGYKDTLTSAPEKARAAAGSVEERTQAQENAIKELDK